MNTLIIIFDKHTSEQYIFTFEALALNLSYAKAFKAGAKPYIDELIQA